MLKFVHDQENRSRPGKKQETEHGQDICQKTQKAIFKLQKNSPVAHQKAEYLS